MTCTLLIGWKHTLYSSFRSDGGAEYIAGDDERRINCVGLCLLLFPFGELDGFSGERASHQSPVCQASINFRRSYSHQRRGKRKVAPLRQWRDLQLSPRFVSFASRLSTDRNFCCQSHDCFVLAPSLIRLISSDGIYHVVKRDAQSDECRTVVNISR
jgi:hypothetical protein